jgi:hypothetical protein
MGGGCSSLETAHHLCRVLRRKNDGQAAACVFTGSRYRGRGVILTIARCDLTIFSLLKPDGAGSTDGIETGPAWARFSLQGDQKAAIRWLICGVSTESPIL